MPDFAAHCLFGEKLDAPAPAETYPALFRWGLQGPDLLFYRKALTGAPYHKIANQMHEVQTAELLGAMADYCAQCQGPEKVRAQAYLYGFAGHYVLDAICHPYVYWHQQQRHAADPKASEGALHCSIESDMDMDLFGYLRGKSACTLEVQQLYAMPVECQRAVGALYTHLLYQVYHILLSPAEVMASLQDTTRLQKALFSGSPVLLGAARALGVVQGKGGDHYASHLKGRQPRWDSLNLNQQPWKNPWTGAESNESVPQLMDRAAEYYQQLCDVLERNAAGARLPVPAAVNFSGQPL